MHLHEPEFERATKRLMLLLAAVVLTACGGRTHVQYRDDTAKLLSQREGEIKSCYDAILKKDTSARGKVTVRFVVEAKTGLIKDTQVNSRNTTASTDLAKCVSGVLDGLTLDPPDPLDGRATFTFVLEAKRKVAKPAEAPKKPKEPKPEDDNDDPKDKS